MSPDDMALARRIANEGFTVYLPLLFGKIGQDSVISGYFQSCAYGEFECSKTSTSSPALKWLRTVCERVINMSGQPVGIIGMCLTGVFPLVLLREGIRAAVLCQPTIPFNLLFGRPINDQKTDIGLDPEDVSAATKSDVPLLTMRYASDKRCPEERVDKLRDIFRGRLADIKLQGQGHSTLGGSFHSGAFADTIKYLKVRLGSDRGPQRMNLAKLDKKACEITADGKWRPL
jgi:dienelactone hydrolase